MDKAEYRIKLEEINRLAEQGDFAAAAVVADEVDWKHVKSARTLCMIGEIYEANRRFEDSCRILKLAYRRSSSSKTVLYRLAELDIKTGNFDEAKKFINEFEQNSPGDMSRYILKYKLLRAEKAPLDEQIAVLRDYRDNEYTERWSYELAKLYKRNGQKERCIEECDDMILWFAEGKYVRKAMELKMSLTALTPSQQLKYDTMLEEEEAASDNTAETFESPETEAAAAAEGVDAEEVAAAAVAAVDETADAAEESAGISEETAAEAESVPAETEAAAEAGNQTWAGDAADAASAAEESAYDALDTLERRMQADDEEDEEDDRPGISADEAIRKMDSAAGRFSIEEQESKKKAAASVSIQERISKGIKGFFAGMKLDTSAEEQAELEADAAAAEPRVGAPESEEDLAEAFEYANEAVKEKEAGEVSAASAEQAGTAEGTSEEVVSGEETAQAADVEESAAEAAADEAADEDADMKIAGEEFDLEALLRETGSAFAGEVASGEYVLADTLEEHLEEAEEQARAAKERNVAADAEAAAEAAEEAARIEAEEREASLIGRETDESLGLTREFHFTEELAKQKAALQEEADTDAEPEERIPIEDPEEAARKLVREYVGGDNEASESIDSVDPEEEYEETESDEAVPSEEPDPVLLAAFEEDEEFADLPAEETPEDAAEAEEPIDVVIAEEADPEEDEPEVFETIPVEGRRLTEEEKKALSYFADIPGIDLQTTAALADIHNNAGDRTSRSGNVLIMGRMGSGKTRLADGLVMMACMHLGSRTAKIGRIIANRLNGKDPAEVVKTLSGGFLIIEAAGELSDETVDRLNRAMDFRTDDLIVILEDEKADLKAVLDRHPDFAEKFSSQITVPVFTNDELVTFAKTYAGEEGYKFDDMATLALYTMIGDNQKDAEPVTVARVREMIDKAITKSSHRIFGKVTDKEDGRVVLQEKDFIF